MKTTKLMNISNAFCRAGAALLKFIFVPNPSDDELKMLEDAKKYYGDGRHRWGGPN